MKFSAPIFLAVMWLAQTIQAAGFVYNENFTIFTPEQASQQATDKYAATVLDKAEHYRREIAVEWLGEEIPPSIGQTIVNVSFSNERDRGLTWAKDNPDRKYHTLYLVATPNRDVSHLLAHEMAHVVLATRFPAPDRLPAWLEEGIASRYDDEQRQATRGQIVKWMARTQNWPQLVGLLAEANISSQDQEAYTVCATLTELLLTRGEKKTLLKFGQAGNKLGWDRALKEHYGIGNVAQLQAEWQAWIRQAANSSPVRRDNLK